MDDEIRSLKSIGFDCSPSKNDNKEESERRRKFEKSKIIKQSNNYYRFETLKEVTNKSYYINKDLLNYYQIGIVCNTHMKIAIQIIDEQMCSLPYISIPMDGYKKKSTFLYELLDKIIPKSQRKETIISLKPRIESIVRIEDPKSGLFYHRYTAYHWISSKNRCCQHTDQIIWVTLEDLQNCMNIECLEKSSIILRDDQPYNLLNMIINGNYIYDTYMNEFDTESMLKFITNDSSIFKKYLDSSNIEIIRLLLREFICHCWPSISMSYPLFCKFISKLSPNYYRHLFSYDKSKRLFYSMCNKNKYMLEFSELIIGLLMMNEKICLISKSISYFVSIQELRLKLQFRYYDIDQKGMLTYDNILLILKEFMDEYDKNDSVIRLLQDNIDETKKNFNDWFNHNQNQNKHITFNEFQKLILEDMPKIIKNITKNMPNVYSSLYRVDFDIFQQIIENFHYTKNTQKSIVKSKYEFYKPIKRNCDNCQIKYCLSDSKLQINLSGKVIAIYRLIWTKGHNNDDFKKIFLVDLPDNRIYRIAIDLLIRIRTYGENILKKNTIQQDDLELSCWNYENKIDQIRAIELILQKSKEIFSNEKRVLSITGPILVFGDIHGNLRDLIHFCDANLIGKLPFLSSNKCLFLGDYVDRGDWSVEVIVFLFCLKILSPDSIYLVRGNHELRSVQHEFGFIIECKKKLGLECWRQFNDVFDVLPIAALIDEKIYGAHGGIPTSGNSLEQLKRAPIPLSNPNAECNEVWEALWNDPINDKDIDMISVTDSEIIKKTGGFLLNICRGTGYRFLTEAVRKFMEKNQIDFIVRAHEVQMPGFMFYNQGYTVSVFSTSNYIGSTNSAGALHLNDNKIRCIKVNRIYKPEMFVK